MYKSIYTFLFYLLMAVTYTLEILRGIIWVQQVATYFILKKSVMQSTILAFVYIAIAGELGRDFSHVVIPATGYIN